MAFGIAATVNVEPGPGQIHVAFVGRTRGIVNNYAGLVFKRRDAIDVIDRGHRIAPAQSAVLRCLGKDATFGTKRPGSPNPRERKMSMISRAVAAKINRIVALRQILWISDWNCLPRFAAVHRDIVITAGARSRRAAGLERSGNDVVRIFRIDSNRYFGRFDCVDITNPHHSLSKGNGQTERKDREQECWLEMRSHKHLMPSFELDVLNAR